jgi:hypothetical protein
VVDLPLTAHAGTVPAGKCVLIDLG